MTFAGVALDPLAPWQLVVLATAAGVLALSLALVRRRDGLRWTWAARIGALLMAAGLALNPQIGTDPATYLGHPDVQVIVALDRTASMAVRDDNDSSRLDRAAGDIVHLTRQSDVALSLVTWSHRARVVLPFTTGGTAVARTLSLVAPVRPIAGVGSSMNRPLTTLKRAVTQATTEHPDRATYLVLMTDGEDTEPGRPRSYASIRELLAGGLVVGYGSEAGGEVPLDPERPSAVVLDPRTHEPAISKRDAANLRRVAAELGVGYVGRDDPAFAKTLASSLQPPAQELSTSTPRSVAWLFAILLLGFTLPDLRAICLSARELRRLGGVA